MSGGSCPIPFSKWLRSKPKMQRIEVDIILPAQVLINKKILASIVREE